MKKKQSYILTITLSFIILFILTSIISYHKSISYHQIDYDHYIAIETRQIQPFYDINCILIWGIGIFFLTLFTYLYFRKYDDSVSKRILVDYKLLLKTTFISIGILYFIGISGEFFPSFHIGKEEMHLITKTEFEEKIRMYENDINDFNKGNWIVI